MSYFTFSGSPPQQSMSMSLDDIMDDLYVRHMNSPDVFTKIDRCMFQLELAHWFYIDEYYDHNPKNLPKLNFKEFCMEAFDRWSILRENFPGDIKKYIKSFEKYKNAVPVCGCILLNRHMTKVLMIKPYGHGTRSWTFPRGKINENESSIDCAIRETREEIGFHADKDKLNEKDTIEAVWGRKKVRLYIVTDVSEKTHFETKTIKEVSAIDWQLLSKMKSEDERYQYAWPVIRKLKRWIKENKKRGNRSNSHKSHVNNTNAQSKDSGKHHKNKRSKSKNSSPNASRRRDKKDTPNRKDRKKKKERSRSKSSHTVSSSIPIQFSKSGNQQCSNSGSSLGSPSFSNFRFDHNEMLKAVRS